MLKIIIVITLIIIIAIIIPDVFYNVTWVFYLLLTTLKINKRINLIENKINIYIVKKLFYFSNYFIINLFYSSEIS